MEERRRTNLRKRNIIFGTRNFHVPFRKINEINDEPKQLKMKIAVLAETRKNGQGSEN